MRLAPDEPAGGEGRPGYAEVGNAWGTPSSHPVIACLKPAVHRVEVVPR